MQFIDTPPPFYQTEAGLYFEPAQLYIDPKKKVPRALISHAHADHSSAGISEAWATRETISLVNLRMGQRSPVNFSEVMINQPLAFGEDTSVTFMHAGHMLGSAMILIEHRNTRYLYTGDYKLSSDPTCHPAQICQCDVLFTEVTFGSVKYNHPEPDREISKLSSYLPGKLVISCYKQGKAQRITKMLSDRFPGVQIFVHPEIIPYHNCYQSHDVDLGSWIPYRRRDFLSSENAVLIATPGLARGYLRNPEIRVAFATGWKRFIPNMGIHLHISDHVDNSELREFIGRCGASRIVTFHGDDQELRKLIGSESQLKLNI
jgi:putative mRNA 3-end processing factor